MEYYLKIDEKALSKNTIQNLGVAFSDPNDEVLFESFINEKLEENVGQKIYELLSEAQINEWNKITDDSERSAWLKANVPSYRMLAVSEILKIKKQIMRLSKQLSSKEVTDRTIYATPIECADFSSRTVNCLKRYGVASIGEVINMPPEKWRTIRNLSNSCLNEIEETIRSKYGYSIMR